MKCYELQGPGGVDALALVDKPVPQAGPGEVLVRLKAATLNYRDLLTVKGGYGSRQKFPLVPVSDGAGVVEDELVHDFLNTRCLTIAGGTEQILLTVAAERLLGLPR